MPGAAALAASQARPARTTRADRQTEQNIRIAVTMLDAARMHMSPMRMHTLVRRYESRGVAGKGWSFNEFFLTQMQLDEERARQVRDHPDVRRVIAYLDPTGETATRNVVRERGY